MPKSLTTSRLVTFKWPKFVKIILKATECKTAFAKCALFLFVMSFITDSDDVSKNYYQI